MYATRMFTPGTTPPKFVLNSASSTSSESYASDIAIYNKLSSSTPLDKLIKDSFVNYMVCTDIATNSTKSSYYKILDPSGNAAFAVNIKSNDWTYAANYFYTVYKFAKQSNFCVTPISSGKINDYIDCESNKSSSSTIDTPGTINILGTSIPEVGSTAAVAGGSGGLLSSISSSCSCCICIMVILFIVMNAGKRRHRKHGGYFYSD
jgi:hypothetical protein